MEATTLDDPVSQPISNSGDGTLERPHPVESYFTDSRSCSDWRNQMDFGGDIRTNSPPGVLITPNGTHEAAYSLLISKGLIIHNLDR